jgi:hypothetical protein
MTQGVPLSHGYAIGDVQGLLTIAAFDPLVVKCACGITRTDRAISHLLAGLESCGCRGRAARAITNGMTINGHRVISPHKRHPLVRGRSWNVECVRCKTVDTIGEEGLVARAKRNAQGCRACNRFKRA